MFVQFMGTDRPGKEIVTITDVKLNNYYFTEVPDELKLCTIPANTNGEMQEINAAAYKLHFAFLEKNGYELHQATFWVRKAYFDNFFKK